MLILILIILIKFSDKLLNHYIPASRTPLGSTYSPEPFCTPRTPLGKFVLPVGSTPLILYSPWGVHLLFVDSSELGKLN